MYKLTALATPPISTSSASMHPPDLPGFICLDEHANKYRLEALLSLFRVSVQILLTSQTGTNYKLAHPSTLRPESRSRPQPSSSHLSPVVSCRGNSSS